MTLRSMTAFLKWFFHVSTVQRRN